MHLREDTRIIMEGLGAFCRSGDGEQLIGIPGMTPGRVDQYRRLVNNVLRDALDSAFPVTFAALEEEQWDALVQEFFREGASSSPQVWLMPREFYHFHAGKNSGVRHAMPWLEDLLSFEWMEIEMYNMPDREMPAFFSLDGTDEFSSFLNQTLVFNPEHEILSLEYPIHLYGVAEATVLKGNYFVLIYRSPLTGFVHFMDLSPLHVYILNRMMEEHLPLGEFKHEVAIRSGIESLRYLEESLGKFLKELYSKGLILGSSDNAQGTV